MRGLDVILSWAAIAMLLTLPVTGAHRHIHTPTSGASAPPAATAEAANPSQPAQHLVHAFDSQHSLGVNLGDHQDVEPHDTPVSKLTVAILLTIMSGYLIWSTTGLQVPLPRLRVARRPLRYCRPLAHAPPGAH